LCKVQQKSGARRTERDKVSLHSNVSKNSVECLFKRNKMSNGGILRPKISMRGLKWCIAHVNSMCARQDIAIQNLCHA